MDVPLRYGPSLETGKPRLLFEISHKPGTFNYDLSADGKRFLFIQSVEPEQLGTNVDVVINWKQELLHKVIAGG